MRRSRNFNAPVIELNNMSDTSQIDAKHKYMYGWSYNEKEANTTKIVEYNFGPDVLHKLHSLIPLPIWRVISDYAETIKSATFELWGIDSIRYENGNVRAQNCNWYGHYTYGTCWFRGCKIWLTPIAGYVFQNIPEFTYIYSNENQYTVEMKKLIGKQFGKHSKDLKKYSLTGNMNYDTFLQPFREESPIETMNTLHGGIYNALPYSDSSQIGRKSISWEILQSYKKRGNLTESAVIYLYDCNHSNPNDSSEGGVEVAIIYNLDAICKELEWIQTIAENNHSVRFLWL